MTETGELECECEKKDEEKLPILIWKYTWRRFTIHDKDVLFIASEFWNTRSQITYLAADGFQSDGTICGDI